MSKTYAKNSVINENFTEVPNLSVYYKNRANMSRSYQVNSAFGQSVSNSSVSIRNTNQSNSTAHLFDEEEEPRSKISRYLGIAFLLALVVTSISFLMCAIFYDEIFDEDGETAEEYWERIQKEILQLQNRTRYEIYNKTLMSALEANHSFSVSMKAPPPSKPSITLKHFIDREFSPETFAGKWISSNELLHYDFENNLCITNVEHMNKSIVIPFRLVKQFHLSGLALSPDRQYFLAQYNTQRLYRYTTSAKYRIFSLNESLPDNARLSWPLSVPESPKEIFIRYAEWGPIGSQLIFVAKNDIYYKASVNSLPLRLTVTGKESVIFNGVPDWVYEEEIICEPKTFWISPDGQNLVYASINDSAVGIMTWPYYGAQQEFTGVFNQYPKIQSVRYPKPGRANPTVSLYFIPLSKVKHNIETQQLSDSNAHELTVYLKPAPQIRILKDYYFTTFKWIDDDLFGINWMNRPQNFSVMTLYSTKNYLEPNVNFILESNNGWVDLFTAPLITPDRSSYLLKVPKISNNMKDTFHHIARVSVNSAKSEFLTSGIFDVKKLLDINSETEKIYFIATFPGDPGSTHLMSVPLNKNQSTESICHTCLMNKYNQDLHQQCLVSEATFSTDGSYYIFECQGPGIPRIEIRKTLDDSLVSTLVDNQELSYKLKGLSLPKRIMLKVPVGRYDIDVMLIVPETFDPKSNQKYPLVIHIYGGPGSDNAAVTQSYFYDQFSAFLASNQSVIYAFLDARGNPNHGCKFMFDVYRKLGLVEVEDVLGVAKYLKTNTTYIDKIGIWGWSYGGFLTTLALESDRDNSVFNCGVAVAPVSDWLYYDSVYVERYMGFPIPDDNLKNYQASSTLDKVKYLKGKEFLVMFGTADDNVHPINSMMLLKAMNEENIKYQTHIFPDNSHGLHSSHQYVYGRITDFFGKCFENRSTKI